MAKYQDIDAYCCIELFKTVRAGYLDEVVSGIFFPNQDDSTCKGGVPRLSFCPFCGAEIQFQHKVAGWRWWTVKRGKSGRWGGKCPSLKKSKEANDGKG